MPYRLNPSATLNRGRFTLWHPPKKLRTYSMGVDCALGRDDGDFDAAVILDEDGEQCATLHGRWGAGAFFEVLWPIVKWFEPFCVVEAASDGNALLRSLYDKGAWLYFERQDGKKGRPSTERLGHVPKRFDPPVQALRDYIGPKDKTGKLLPPRITVHDEELHGQLCKFGYMPKGQGTSIHDVRDDKLIWGAPPGEHDDLVRACALAVYGLEWLPHYERPKPTHKPGTLGHLLNHEAVLDGEDDDQPMSNLERASKRK